ncbi:MAG TPA: NFACT RNA binding domain-containing protein [Candidatus Cloacimonadota bacterium]|nr:NFACT RNA binding domain-containing protein [Candidatus Cloacimonadota bacterium]HPT71960.1 NFACT RNA binding domain-containing protein [Candidatus Cloacimonadota bacterium]
MQYKYLKHWVNENSSFLSHKIINGLEQFENQWCFLLFSEKRMLQVNLESKDPYVFITDKNELPFQIQKDSSILLKNIGGCKIGAIELDAKDRVLHIDLQKTDMYLDKLQLRLIIELIPSHPNIVLTRIQNDREIVIDAMRKFSLAENPHRQILPGSIYMPPPPITDDIPVESIQTPLEITPIGKIVTSAEGKFNDLNSLFESLYYEYHIPQKAQELRQNIIKKLNSEVSKLEKKLNKQKDELENAKDEETWFRYAELLKANLHSAKSGMKSIQVTNYFEEGFPTVEIPLHENKSLRMNMEDYLRKYRKAKSGRRIIEENIRQGKIDLEKLHHRIDEIRSIESYLKLRSLLSEKGIKSIRQEKTHYRDLPVNDDWEIQIGRSARENDQLTCNIANPQDWWFHTRIYQGTHVVLRNYRKQEVPDDLKLLCARLAAYYSKAKSSSQVPVDYTQIRYVRKPRGSAPGYVTYTHQHTLFVDPISFRDAAAYIANREGKQNG